MSLLSCAARGLRVASRSRAALLPHSVARCQPATRCSLHAFSTSANESANAATQATPAAAQSATAAAVPSLASSAAPPPTSPRSSSSSSSSAPPRRRATASSGAPPSSAQFFRFGLPFLLFMVVGSLGYAKLLQPALDQKDSGARSMLYGQSRADPEAKPGTTKTFAKPEIKMRTLEEEYERSKKQWKNEYEIKPVPRPADAPKMREKGEHSL